MVWFRIDLSLFWNIIVKEEVFFLNFRFLISKFSVSPRETNNKDSPASQADSGIFSIASSASPSKIDGGINTDVRSPDSPRSNDKTEQCKFYNSIENSIWFKRLMILVASPLHM